VWHECARVLRPGGVLLAGFNNPVTYIFDQEALWERGEIIVRYRLPYADVDDLPPERLARLLEQGEAVEFSHTLEDQIGGQCDAGLMITGLFEDRWDDDGIVVLNSFFPWFIATRAVKP